MSHKAFYTFSIFAFLSGLIVTYQFLGTVTPGTTKFTQYRQQEAPETIMLAEDSTPNTTTQAVANYVNQLEATQTVLGITDPSPTPNQPDVLGTSTETTSQTNTSLIDKLLNQPKPKYIGYITIASPSRVSLNTHEKLQTSSPVTGTIYYGTNYPYSQIQANWYLTHIENTNQSGWVQAQFVTEVTNNN